MNLIDLKNQKTNSNLLLLLTGVIIIPGLNYSEAILGRLILLLSKVFEFSLIVGLASSYVFQTLIIIGLVYLIIKILCWDINKKPLITIHTGVFKYIWIVFLILFILSPVLTYFTYDLNQTSIKNYVDNNLQDIHNREYYLNILNKLISFVKMILIVILYFVVLRVSNDKADTQLVE